jgi:ABC-type Na+ efflux pump permease subunit
LAETEALIVAVYDPGDSALVAALRELPEIELQEVDSETAVLTTLMLIGIGMLAGFSSKSKQQCNNYAGFLGIGLNLPGWFALIPLAGLAFLPALLIRLIPTFYFTNTLVYALDGRATLQTVGPNLLILAGCAVAVFLAVRWRLGVAWQLVGEVGIERG